MKNGKAIHGGDVFAAARELGVHWRDVLDFSANINPLGPPPGLKKHLFDIFDLTENYPEPFAESWLSDLAARHGLSSNEILAGNGTTHLMYLVARVLMPKKPVAAFPAFAEYERSLIQNGNEIQGAPCRLEDEFDLTDDVVTRMFKLKPDLVFLTNPTSPAGRLVDPKILKSVVERADKTGAHVVLDEAFLDFTPAPSLARSVRRFKRLIVMRSLTKFYALPGLRLGYLVTSKEMVKKLKPGLEPWSVNGLALAAGKYCLDQDDYAIRTKKMVDTQRLWLTKRLTDLGLGRVIPGEANYLLVKIEAPGLTENRFIAKMKERGILVRGCTSFQGVLRGYIRLAVKTPAANKRLVKAVKDLLTGEGK